MADETKVIEGTVGPYAGQRLTLPTADAEAAISDGWARDPFAPVDPNAEPKEQTDEDRARIAEAAQQAARKLRGEDEKPDKPEADKPKAAKPEAATAKPPEPEQRDMKPDDKPGDYTTRSGRPPRRT